MILFRFEFRAKREMARVVKREKSADAVSDLRE